MISWYESDVHQHFNSPQILDWKTVQRWVRTFRAVLKIATIYNRFAGGFCWVCSVRQDVPCSPLHPHLLFKRGTFCFTSLSLVSTATLKETSLVMCSRTHRCSTTLSMALHCRTVWQTWRQGWKIEIWPRSPTCPRWCIPNWKPVNQSWLQTGDCRESNKAKSSPEWYFTANAAGISFLSRVIWGYCFIKQSWVWRFDMSVPSSWNANSQGNIRKCCHEIHAANGDLPCLQHCDVVGHYHWVISRLPQPLHALFVKNLAQV